MITSINNFLKASLLIAMIIINTILIYNKHVLRFGERLPGPAGNDHPGHLNVAFFSDKLVRADG